MPGVVVRKVSQSGNFKESVRYVLRQGRHADKASPVCWGVVNLAPDEQHADRLAWEMQQTAQHADRLKELAGVPAKHRKRCKTPVLHRLISYGEYEPAADEMRRDVQEHLRALGLDQQECVWACHNDNGLWHVHMIINKIDPRTGLAVKLDNDYARADAWRLQWDTAHNVVSPDNDNKAPATSQNAKDRGEWKERQHITAEIFKEASRLLHGQLNAAQADELRAFCKANAAQWTATARDRTKADVRKVFARAYAEARAFAQPRRVYVQGYWTTEHVTKFSRRGRLYLAQRRRYVRGHVHYVRPSWIERYMWARGNADRFRAVGLAPPTLWGCAFASSFLASLNTLHAAEKSASKEAAKVRREVIRKAIVADALAPLKRKHRAEHDAMTPQKVRDAAQILLAERRPTTRRRKDQSRKPSVSQVLMGDVQKASRRGFKPYRSKIDTDRRPSK